MVLSGDWTQVQVVELENDGGGLGMGIVGGRTSGVVIKTIVGGSPADKVALILRHQYSGPVRLVVARPAEPSSPQLSRSSRQAEDDDQKQYNLRGTVTLPTRVVTDPLSLEEHLSRLLEDSSAVASSSQMPDIAPDLLEDYALLLKSVNQTTFKLGRTLPPIDADLIEVTLVRDAEHGLGITVAGYVHDKDLSWIR